LVYGGIANNIVRISYKEYQVNREGAFIRDAFNQNVQYDISKERNITFRNMEIEIIDASSNKITYRVINAPNGLVR